MKHPLNFLFQASFQIHLTLSTTSIFFTVNLISSVKSHEVQVTLNVAQPWLTYPDRRWRSTSNNQNGPPTTSLRNLFVGRLRLNVCRVRKVTWILGHGINSFALTRITNKQRNHNTAIWPPAHHASHDGKYLVANELVSGWGVGMRVKLIRKSWLGMLCPK